MLKLFAFAMIFGSLLFGFILSKGNLGMLWHPYELIMIFGPVLSCFIIANPVSVVKSTASQLIGVFGKDKYTQDFYSDSLILMFELTKLYKEKGNVELENHIDSPEDSEIFKKYPKILKDKESLNFISENLRLVTNGKYSPHDVESYIDAEIDAFVHEHALASKALDQVADMLPSLGIVVAVAGIIISMQYIGSTAEIFAEKISAALFGTFVGVFAAYAIVFPISKSMESKTEKFKHYLEVLKSSFLSIVHGYPPFVAVEIARKNIPPTLRISSSVLEKRMLGEN